DTWSIDKDTGILEGGTMREPPKNKRHEMSLQCGEDTWEDYRLEVDVWFDSIPQQLTSRFSGAILLARMKGDSFYSLEYGTNGVQTQINLARILNNESLKVLDDKDNRAVPPELHVTSRKWYSLRLDVQGKRLRGFVNDDELVKAELVEAADDKLKSGRAGLV